MRPRRRWGIRSPARDSRCRRGPLGPGPGFPGHGQSGPRPRLLVVNFPHNPTGYLPARSELDAIIELARRHGLHVFSVKIGSEVAVSLPTTACLGLLGVALIASNPDHVSVARLADPGAAGAVLRRVVPAAVLVVPAAAWFRLLGERAGLYDEAVGAAIMVVFDFALLIVVGGCATARVASIERRRPPGRAEPRPARPGGVHAARRDRGRGSRRAGPRPARPLPEPGLRIDGRLGRRRRSRRRDRRNDPGVRATGAGRSSMSWRRARACATSR